MHLYDCRVGTFVPRATSGQNVDILRTPFAILTMALFAVSRLLG